MGRAVTNIQNLSNIYSKREARKQKLKDTPLWDKLEGADGKECSELSEETRRRPKRNQQKIKSTGEKIKKATR